MCKRSFGATSALLDSGDQSPEKSDDTGKTTQLVDPDKDTTVKDLLVIALPKPLIPGGVPQFIRISDQPLLRELKELQQLGDSTPVVAFMRNPVADDDARGADDDAGEDGAGAFSPVSAEDLASVGTLATVKGLTWSGAEGQQQGQVVVQGFRRMSRLDTVNAHPLRVRCKPLINEPFNAEAPDVKAMHAEMVQTMKHIFELQPIYLEQMRHVRTGDFHDMSRLCDLLVSLVNGGREDCQQFLAESNVPRRMTKALEILKKEIDIIMLQRDISKRVEEKFSKDQKRYFLMEQLKHIQKELGLTKDDKSALVQKFQERFNPHRDAAPEEARTVIDEEIAKLQMLEPASSEYNVTRNYLDWLTSIPWGVVDEERFDIPAAQSTLDADHYGMQDVKDRILEFIAVAQLNSSTQGKILCMVGPPGVGKTSIGKSIADALGRQFYRFSVGGLSDVAEIKGHRRTYVGAMPGKVVQCLKQVKSSNPLVLIDEIDKLGRGWQGDPASALLELLDPEQNSAFRDHYLDVPVDLSKALFVCTANVLDTIPGPLLDRMEVIQIAGYTTDEKRNIARNYLEPQARRACAVPDGAAAVADDAMTALIERYCRESGVRNLKKHLEKIYRKLALELVNSGLVTWQEVLEEAEGEQAGKGGAVAAPAAAPAPADAPDAATVAVTTDTLTDAAPGEGHVAGTDGDGSQPDKAPKTKKVPRYSGETLVVDSGNLHKYVGKPPFNSDRFYSSTPAGVVMGLAWTSMGGSTLYVESNKVSASGDAHLTLTGQMGDVMKESAVIAQTFCRRLLRALDPENEFLEKGTVHLHVPEGATPKDGPSAGCTLVTALLSLATNTPVIADVAMTGEISLSGRMLPIGGVKEKTLAAKRSGVKTIIFPAANRKDWDELTEELRSDIEPHFVRHYVDIFPIVFPGLADKFAATLTQLEADVTRTAGPR